MHLLFGVVGDPVEHSLSPVIHEEFFRLTGLEGEYKKFYIQKGMLKEGIYNLLQAGVTGFNITIPHKTDIIPLLDNIDDTAQKIGAVNTVKVENGKLIGYNTDAEGYILSLQKVDPDFTKKSFVLIGAGGAAKAIYYALIKNGVKKLDICNRTLKKAEDIIKEANQSVTTSKPLSFTELEENINAYDVFIQTTSVGMKPNIDDTPLYLKHFNGDGKIVSDIIYTPSETKFLHLAKEKGATTFNGLDMLLYQAALAFRIWTGEMPTIDTAKELVMKQLEGDR